MSSHTAYRNFLESSSIGGVVRGIKLRIPGYAVHTEGQSASPEASAYKLADSGGLYLLVQPNGSELWRYKFRVCSTEGLKALGAFPEIVLAEARGLHTDARKLVVQGINPIQARRDEKIVQAQGQ